MNSTERRRVTMATIFTLVAFIALWAANRSDAVSEFDTIGSTAVTTPTTVYAPEPPIFVGGNAADPPPAPADIEVGPVPTQNERIGRAGFHTYQGALLAVCSTNWVPEGYIVKVTNVNNGRSVSCINWPNLILPAGTDIVLDTFLLTSIADLADAPITVRVSW
mgnify:FL=1